MSRGKHGAYKRHLLCQTCGFGWPANNWRKHVRVCRRVPDGARCPECWDFIPCRKPSCSRREEPKEVTKKEVPTLAVVRSLEMQVTKTPKGQWRIAAWWLPDAIYADTWEAGYWAAIKILKELQGVG